MAMDTLKNLAYGVVLLPPTPPNLGTSLTLASGHGARFPAPPFNVSIWPFGVPADPVNTEIVRVVAKAGDVLTIQRTQENTQPRTILNADQVAQAMTARFISDLITDLRAYDTTTLNSAKAYTDQLRTDMNAAISAATAPLATKAYVDGQDAIYYNDYISRDATVVANANARMDSQDAAYWNATAKPYVDGRDNVLINDYAARDTTVTNNANSRMDSQDVAYQNAANSRMDSQDQYYWGQTVSRIDAQILAARSTPRVYVTANTTGVTPNCDTTDMVWIYALAQGMSIGNPIGTPHDGQILVIRIRDNGNSQGLAWGSNYMSSTAVPLPTATGPARLFTLGFRYNAILYGQWQMIALSQGAT